MASLVLLLLPMASSHQKEDAKRKVDSVGIEKKCSLSGAC